MLLRTLVSVYGLMFFIKYAMESHSIAEYVAKSIRSIATHTAHCSLYGSQRLFVICTSWRPICNNGAYLLLCSYCVHIIYTVRKLNTSSCSLLIPITVQLRSNIFSDCLDQADTPPHPSPMMLILVGLFRMKLTRCSHFRTRWITKYYCAHF